MTRLTSLNRSVQGKIALITGAASGMGRATAHLFADEGAHVAVTDINAEGVADVVREIEDAGLSAKGWTLDLADPQRIKAVTDEVHLMRIADMVMRSYNETGSVNHATGDLPL